MYEANSSAEEVVNITPQKSQVVNEKPKKKFKWKKFFGYFFLGILVLGIGYLGYRFYEFKPYRVIASNVTSRSATISWVTDSAEPGMVVYKEGNTILPIWISKYGMGNGYDDRDYSNAELEAASKTQENIAESGDISAEDIETEIIVTELGTYWSHHVSIRNLNPETEYEFMVGDGLVFEKANTVDTENNIVTTLQEDDEIRTPVPAYGIVRYYDNEEFLRVNDGIVYLILSELITGAKSELISSITNDEGGWYIDLASAYTSDGKKFINIIADEEYVNIYADIVIEGVQYGRWNKKVAYQYISPTHTIDLYNPDDNQLPTKDEYLEYQEKSIKLSFLDKLIGRVFAHSNRYGTCSGDACGCGGQCGFVNSSPCVCSCNGVTKSIGAGTTCQVAETTEVAKTDADIAEVPNVLCPRATGSSTSGGCSGNGGACYYNNGFTDSKGNYCYNGRWINETDKEKWDSGGEYSNIAYGANPSGGSSSSTPLGKKCCGFPAGTNVWKDLALYDSCEGSLEDLTGKVTVCSGTYNSAEPLSRVCCGFPAGSGSWTNLNMYNSTCPDGYDNLTGVASMCEGSYTTTTLSSPICCAMYFPINNKWSLFTNWTSCPSGSIPYTVSLLSNCSGYLDADKINTTADVDTSTRCEDSSFYDLISSSSAEGFYYNCGKSEVYEQKEYRDKTSCANNTFFIGGYCCDEMEGKYSFMSGKYVKCSSDNVWIEVTKDDISKKVTYAYDILEANETCDISKYEYCYCPLSDEIFTDQAQCVKLSQLTRLVRSVFASTNSQDSYLIDTENSMIQNLTPGIYSFDYNNESYIFEVTEYEYLEAGGEFSLYIDVNKDGIIDDTDINVTNSAKEIELTAIKKGFNYSLQEGFNFVSFPFIFTDDDIKTASDLLTYLNNKYNDSFYSISKYDSGKWVMVGGNGGTYDQNDFQLIPGQGYVLKTRWDVDITLYGNEVTYDSSTDSAPIYLSSGWNLVGLYGTSVKSYTAESILKDITNYEDINFTAVNVSRWVESRALYEALQRDTDGTVYGLDFPIELKKSYFIKVTEGEGNWEPGIK